jgi:hypothetical protein
MEALFSFEATFERDISSDASRKTSSQKYDREDRGGRIRVMSSRTVYKAVTVGAC